MINKIFAEGVEYFYVTEPNLIELRSYDLIGKNIYEIKRVTKIENVRMILETKTIRFNGSFFANYFCWLEEKDLDELDEKVKNDRYTDADFKYAVRTYYKEKIICFKCGSKWDGFAVDTGDPYLGNKQLFRQKIQLINDRNARLHCPNCNEKFRIYILKLIGIHESNSVPNL